MGILSFGISILGADGISVFDRSNFGAENNGTSIFGVSNFGTLNDGKSTLGVSNLGIDTFGLSALGLPAVGRDGRSKSKGWKQIKNRYF